MRTVHEVSRLTGVSIRTLQYYDRIGLLPPAEYTDAGYRLYDDAALETLQQILLFRELEFPLKDIGRIIHNPSFDRQKALDQQIELLELKKEHLDSLITLARGIRTSGGKSKIDFQHLTQRSWMSMLPGPKRPGGIPLRIRSMSRRPGEGLRKKMRT